MSMLLTRSQRCAEQDHLRCTVSATCECRCHRTCCSGPLQGGDDHYQIYHWLTDPGDEYEALSETASDGGEM